MINHSSQSKGFVILFAILISAIILLIGVGIFRITVKETILSSSSRESMLAFFAADGGMECVLEEANTDLSEGFMFPPGTSQTPGSGTGYIQCYGTSTTYTTNSYITNTVRLALPQGCAEVYIERNLQVPGSSLHTRIIARGFNLCDLAEPEFNNPLLLERVLELTYPNP